MCVSSPLVFAHFDRNIFWNTEILMFSQPLKLHRKHRAVSKPMSLTHIRWFDGDAALLLVFARVCEAGLSGAGWGNDPRFGHQRVGQSGLPMIHMGNHRHVPDVGLLVHDGPDLIHSEVHLVVGLSAGGYIHPFTNSRGSFYSSYASIYWCPLPDLLPSRVIKRKACWKLNPSAPLEDFTFWCLTEQHISNYWVTTHAAAEWDELCHFTMTRERNVVISYLNSP